VEAVNTAGSPWASLCAEAKRESDQKRVSFFIEKGNAEIFYEQLQQFYEQLKDEWESLGNLRDNF